MRHFGYCSSPEVAAKLTQAMVDRAVESAKARAWKERRAFVAKAAAKMMAGYAGSSCNWNEVRCIGEAVSLANALESQGQAPWTANGKEIAQ